MITQVTFWCNDFYLLNDDEKNKISKSIIEYLKGINIQFTVLDLPANWHGNLWTLAMNIEGEYTAVEVQKLFTLRDKKEADPSEKYFWIEISKNYEVMPAHDYHFRYREENGSIITYRKPEEKFGQIFQVSE